MGDTLAISRSLRDELVALAASSEDEVCGLLVSTKHVLTVLPCANVHPEPAGNFEIDPAALIATYREHRAGGAQIVGCFHSHPSGSATPSRRDAEAAAPDGWVWLIVAQGDIRAWRAVRDGAVHGRFDPVALIEAPACA